jgi:hypothetical protein
MHAFLCWIAGRRGAASSSRLSMPRHGAAAAAGHSWNRLIPKSTAGGPSRIHTKSMALLACRRRRRPAGRQGRRVYGIPT